MRHFRSRPVVLTALTALIAGAAATVPAEAAHAETRVYCNEYINAGYSNSGSTYWGWCHANAGQYVKFQIHIDCNAGGGGTTPPASGSGSGTVYTQSVTCWFGGTVTNFWISNPA